MARLLRWLVASDLLSVPVLHTCDIYATTYRLHMQEVSELSTSLDDVSTQHNLVNPAQSHSFLPGAEHHREEIVGPILVQHSPTRSVAEEGSVTVL